MRSRIRGFFLYMQRIVIGDDHANARRCAQRAQAKHRSILTSLAQQDSEITEEQLENLEGRSLIRACAELEEQAARPIWLVPQRLSIMLLVIVTLTFLLALWRHADSIPIELTATLDQLELVFDDSEITEPVLLDFRGLALDDVEISNVSHGDGLAPRHYFLGRDADNTVAVRLAALQIPRQRFVSIQASPRTLTILIRPGADDDDDSVVAQFSVPMDGLVESIDESGELEEPVFDRSVHGPTSLVLREHPDSDGPVQLILTTSRDLLPSSIPFSLVGVDLNEFRLARLPEPDLSTIDSFILGGEIRFPKHEIESISLRRHEVVSLSGSDGSSPRGQLVSASLAIDESQNILIDATWTGVTESLMVGRESQTRNAMPKMIFGWTAQKQTLYLAGFLIYVGIFGYALLTRTRPSMMDATDVPGILE